MSPETKPKSVSLKAEIEHGFLHYQIYHGRAAISDGNINLSFFPEDKAREMAELQRAAIEATWKGIQP